MKRTRAKNTAYYVMPAVLSSVCVFFFTIIDGIFIGRGVNTDALGAVNIALPFIMIVNAFNMLITMGGVTITAIRLGRGDNAGANRAFMGSLAGIGVVSALLCVAGVCFTGQLARILGANNTYFPYVYDYLFWYSLFLIISGTSILLQGFCRNDGSPRLVTVTVAVSAGANIFLDWLFIFPLQKGVAGAAIATGISQTISLCIVLSHFIRKKGVLRIKRFTPDFALWRKIAIRGLPEMTAQFALPVTTLCLNYTLLDTLGGDAVNAYAIINYVASFSLMVFFGTSEGLQPLFGQSYGAKKQIDLKYYFRAGIVINVSAGIAIFILLLFTGGAIYGLFGADETALGIAIAATPEFSWCFLFLALNTIISSYLYSTKRTKEAVIINVCRGLIFDPVIIMALPVLLGGYIVWFTAGIAEILTLAAALALLKHSEKGGITFR